MKLYLCSLILLVTAFPVTMSAQEAPTNFEEEFLIHFNSGAKKFEALAEAMPADAYSWSPGEGVMSVERVFMHIARYNYNYLVQNMGMELPAGIDLQTMESITGKERVMEELKRSNEYVRKILKHMSAGDLNDETRLYGRDVQNWAVLFQLVSHMKEHLGQSIAYARMNEVKPPWAR